MSDVAADEKLGSGEQAWLVWESKEATVFFVRSAHDKRGMKAAQGFMNKDDVGSLFSRGVPTALTAYGALVSGSANPFGLHTIGSSLLIGAAAAYFDYKRSRSAHSNPYGAAYLICLDKEFAGTHRFPAELSRPTFCTFAREFWAFTARGCSMGSL